MIELLTTPSTYGTNEAIETSLMFGLNVNKGDSTFFRLE